MAFDDLVIRGTAWASLLAWAAAELLRRSRRLIDVRARAARAAFTMGGVALLAHSVLAFHLRYGWSHEVALQDTARQTFAVTGLAFGGGLFVNDLFLLLWVVEIAWWWGAPARYLGRAAVLDRSVRAFFLFMFLNGAVVFVSGPLRWVGLLVTVAVLGAWYRGARGRGAGAGEGEHG